MNVFILNQSIKDNLYNKELKQSEESIMRLKILIVLVLFTSAAIAMAQGTSTPPPPDCIRNSL